MSIMSAVGEWKMTEMLCQERCKNVSLWNVFCIVASNYLGMTRANIYKKLIRR